ncbi:MAG: PIN domain-containing protein [Dehalococcoidia bacterium]|nr:PIN domain-containing protein [Dehalococcoidia bacterium]
MTQAGGGFVVDASVAAKWHLRYEDNADKALQLLRNFTFGSTILFAPHLIRYEVPAAIANAARGPSPRLQPAVARRAIEAFLAMGVRTLDDDDLLLDAQTLVHRHGCAFYDALYLALAERLSLPVLTADERFLRSVRGHQLVTWLGDYPSPG